MADALILINEFPVFVEALVGNGDASPDLRSEIT